HDIGKNLVDIILTNNGFEVVNLGIKVPSEQLIQAVREHGPDVIGLSGLLVKSAQQMVVTAGDLKAVGIETPLLVGGAALTRRFTHRKIAAAYGSFCTYAKDAMSGLRLVERLMDSRERPSLEEEVAGLLDQDLGQEKSPSSASVGAEKRRVEVVSREVPVPRPPDLERHVADLDLDRVWPLINPQMIYAKHLGLKGSVEKLATAADPKYLKLEAIVDELKAFARQGAMRCRAVWRFFPARARGDRLTLLDPDSGEVAASWVFPRQSGGGLCLADYVLEDDHVAAFVTTAGEGVRAQVEAWKEAGEYVKSHAFAALALETAEAAAEWLHRELRQAWGFPDPPELTPRDLFSTHYQGRRYSFGYPACPDLSFQQELFRALHPEEIGVHLTDGDMMDPEASVSALVFHHPEAKYFGV
ncbi:MAG: cobalamin-dependent protein, partial [Acidobacteria bacterium]|nr:cobalamin-dependent protein [Acidobacteriota bacterium]